MSPVSQQLYSAIPFNPTVKFMNVRQSSHTDPCSKKGPSLGLNVLSAIAFAKCLIISVLNSCFVSQSMGQWSKHVVPSPATCLGGIAREDGKEFFLGMGLKM